MKCVEIVATTGFEGLRVTERPTPKPGPRQVLVRMHAASFNWRDVQILRGSYVRGIPLPRIPLSDGAGEIVEVGSEVTRVKQGDRVCSTFFQTWMTGPVFAEAQDAALGGTAEGVLSEYVVLEGDGVIRFPEHLSFDEAATLPCAALTAWHGLIEAGSMRAGDTALLLGTGGVSVFGLQLARAAGANAIITSSSDQKLERAKALGATGTVNYATNAKWPERVRELTGGRGADHTLDVVGGEFIERRARSAARRRPCRDHRQPFGGRQRSRPRPCSAQRAAGYRHQYRQPRHVRGNEPRHHRGEAEADGRQDLCDRRRDRGL